MRLVAMNSTNDSFINNTYLLPFGSPEVVFAATTIITMCAFGTLANAVTIATVLHSNKLRSPFYYLMMSLSVSDLLSAIISILVLYRLTWGYDYWYWSEFLCKMLWSIDIWTSFVTSLHIFVFAFLRFVSVYWPQKSDFLTLSRTKKCTAVIWLLTFLIGFVPFLFWFGVVRRDRTQSTITSQWPSCSLFVTSIGSAKIFTEAVYPLLFYIPIILVCIFSVAMIVRILMYRKNRSNIKGLTNQSKPDAGESSRRRKENQIIAQVLLIVGSFLLGYLPRTAYHFYSINPPPVQGRPVYNWWFAFLEYFLLRISECLNPIFYNLSSRKMRKETKNTLLALWSVMGEKKDMVLTKTSRTQVTSEL